MSWTQVLTEAVMQKVHRGVSDPDQAWVLGELIRYLEHRCSGALEFEDMGAGWVTVREAVASGTLRPNDKAVAELVGRWDQLLRYACLRLGRQLGIEVQPVVSRKDAADTNVRAQSLISSLVSRGTLEGAIKIPNTVGPISVTADLRRGRLFASVDVDAPRDGRDQTRVNWLMRQLKDSPDTLQIAAFAMHSRGATRCELLRTARTDPRCLVDEQRRELRTFRLTLPGPMGPKRGAGRGSFVQSVLDLLDTFYGSTVQVLKPWAAAPRKLPTTPENEPVTTPASASSALTSLSSQDGARAAAADDSSSADPAPSPLPSGGWIGKEPQDIEVEPFDDEDDGDAVGVATAVAAD